MGVCRLSLLRTWALHCRRAARRGTRRDDHTSGFCSGRCAAPTAAVARTPAVGAWPCALSCSGAGSWQAWPGGVQLPVCWASVSPAVRYAEMRALQGTMLSLGTPVP